MVRADGIINIVECKYGNEAFVIDKKYAKNLENKVSVFLKQSKYAHTITVVLLTLNGIKSNEYADYLLSDDVLVGDMG